MHIAGTSLLLRCGRDHENHGGRTLRQSYPDHDRRRGARTTEALLYAHFVNSNPEDTRLVPISRTVGTDRVVDEMLFCFTHTREIDWMLPGVPPTGKYVEVPLIAIVCFRDGKLYNEHIYWIRRRTGTDRQAGCSHIAGCSIETARKLVDKTCRPTRSWPPGRQRWQADLA